MKQENVYYYQELHAYHAGIKRTLQGKLEVIKRVLRFLNDPACLHIEIEKLNNYEIKPNQWFDEKHNLIEDHCDLEKNGTIDENGNLITEKHGVLTKTLL